MPDKNKKNRTQLGPLSARAAFTPDSFNEEARTVEVIFGTDTPTRMWDWDRGEFMESMSFEDGHVRWDRLNNGAPVLDNHNQWRGVNGVIAVVEEAKAEDGKRGVATLRFSKREDVEPIFQDVKDGILSGISFGYRVYKYEEETSEEGEIPKMRAIDWEPFEISFAPIQADSGAAVRKNDADLGSVEIIPLPLTQNQRSNEDITMTEAEKKAEVEAKERAANELKAQEAEKTKVERAAIVKAERARASEITTLGRKFGVSDEDVDNYISGDDSIDAVRKSITDKWTAKDPNEGQRSAGSTSVTSDEADKFRTKYTEGVLMRTNPGMKTEAGGEETRGLDLLGMGRDCLERAGESHRGMSKRELAQRAMATSHFPIILGNSVNRSLMAAYELQPRTFTDWANRGTAKDFRTIERQAISGLVKPFKVVQEGGEYEEGTLTEGKEVYSVKKYGEIIHLTWEALINDDLDAFGRLPKAIAAQSAQLQSDLVYGILTANANMNDGVALFHGSHGNLGTNGDISDTTLIEMRKKFRQQTDLAGNFINVSPKFLIVGPEMEALAMKFMNLTHSPATVADKNIHQGTMKIVSEGRISNEDWFVAADPNMIDTVEYSFLEGEGELFTEQQQGFEVDGLKIKARTVIGAKAIDHRGLFKNPNA